MKNFNKIITDFKIAIVAGIFIAIYIIYNLFNRWCDKDSCAVPSEDLKKVLILVISIFLFLIMLIIMDVIRKKGKNKT